MKFAPIILFVYNRPDHTRQTVEALRKNLLAEESELIIFSDAAKNQGDKIQVSQVRQYLKTIRGFKNIRIKERPDNCGLAKSIISGVAQTVNAYGKIIVLEDDLITSPYFLKYMNDALAYYEANLSVISVSGYSYPVKAKLPETYFLKGADCWGWATWKRGWDLFESDGRKLLSEINDKNLSYAFNYNNSYPFTKMLEDQIQGRVDSWAIRWQASAFAKNKLTLYPGQPLVKNIGLDNSGTHCSNSIKYDTVIASRPINIKEIPVAESAFAVKAIVKYFNSFKPGIIKKIRLKLKI